MRTRDATPLFVVLGLAAVPAQRASAQTTVCYTDADGVYRCVEAVDVEAPFNPVVLPPWSEGFEDPFLNRNDERLQRMHDREEERRSKGPKEHEQGPETPQIPPCGDATTNTLGALATKVADENCTQQPAKQTKPGQLQTIASVVGTIRNAPNTAIGFTYACLGLNPSNFGDWSFDRGAFEFTDNAMVRQGAAVTLGQVIIYGPGADPTDVLDVGTGLTLREHERAHIPQGQWLL